MKVKIKNKINNKIKIFNKSTNNQVVQFHYNKIN